MKFSPMLYNPLVNYVVVIRYGDQEFSKYWHWRNPERTELFKWLEEECGVNHIEIPQNQPGGMGGRTTELSGPRMYVELTEEQAMLYKLTWN